MKDLDKMALSYVVHPYTHNKELGAGHDRYAYEIISRAKKLGFQPQIFTSGHLTKISSSAVAEAKMICKLLSCNNNGIFHATATMNAMAPITTRRSKLITTIHDVLWFFVKDLYDSKLKYFIKTSAIKRAAKGSDGIIVPFQSTYDFLESELKVPEDKLFLVPYGVDHDAFYCDKNENPKRPACFGDVKATDKIVLFVGAINRGKGIDTLIKSFDKVVNKVPDALLLIGSTGWDTPIIKDLWVNSPAKDRIKFIGFVPEADLRLAYASADVTCFPSRYGFGLPTLESMACGTPTVSGRTLDAPEFILDAGLMTDPENDEELAESLINILVDETLAASLSAKGIERASHYHWQKTAEQTIDVYREFS